MVVSESPELAVEILQVYKRVNSIAGVPVRAVISHGFKKWFNIGGNSAIVTRYRLDSQFHCLYLQSRGVP
jgi:hypothetical protein